MTIFCKDAERLLSQFLDGELPADRRSEIEEHLRECAICRKTLDEWSKIGTVLIDVTRQKIPAVKHARKFPRRKTAGSRSGLFWTIGVAAAILFAFVAMLMSQKPRQQNSDHIGETVVAVVRKLEGKVTANGMELKEGTDLHEGAKIVVPENARAMVKLTDGSELYLNKATLLHWRERQTLVLEKGEIFVCALPQKESLVIHTPHGEVVVKGTELNIKVNEQTTTVSTITGEVECRNGQGAIGVPTLRQTSLTKDQAPSAVKTINASDILSWTGSLQTDFFIKRIETFDGIKINTDLWRVHDLHDCLRQNSKIIFKGKSDYKDDPPLAELTGKFVIAGDLDIQVDFKTLSNKKAGGRATGSLVLAKDSPMGDDQLFWIGITWWDDKSVYESWWKDRGGDWKMLAEPVGTGGLSGRMRIVQRDGTLQGFFEKEGKWVKYVEHPSFSSNAVRIALHNNIRKDSVTIEFDNLQINEGTILFFY